MKVLSLGPEKKARATQPGPCGVEPGGPRRWRSWAGAERRCQSPWVNCYTRSRVCPPGGRGMPTR